MYSRSESQVLKVVVEPDGGSGSHAALVGLIMFDDAVGENSGKYLMCPRVLTNPPGSPRSRCCCRNSFSVTKVKMNPPVCVHRQLKQHRSDKLRPHSCARNNRYVFF